MSGKVKSFVVSAKSTFSLISTGASSYQNSSSDESGDFAALAFVERGSYRNRFYAVRQAVPVVPLA
jgi:hypothetical protein